jgi:hypothetical protein
MREFEAFALAFLIAWLLERLHDYNRTICPFADRGVSLALTIEIGIRQSMAPLVCVTPLTFTPRVVLRDK